jgi:hypothetical protein
VLNLFSADFLVTIAHRLPEQQLAPCISLQDIFSWGSDEVEIRMLLAAFSNASRAVAHRVQPLTSAVGEMRR